MLDTKLTKSSKLAKVIIFLTVFLPASLLVCLYPRMEGLMLEKQEQLRENISNSVEEEEELFQQEELDLNIYIHQNTLNYIIESSYYLYARLLQEAKEEEVLFDVLDQYGWINDYYTLNQQAFYYAVYEDGKKEYTDSNGLELQINIDNKTAMYDESNLSVLLKTETLNEQMPDIMTDNSMAATFMVEFDAYGMISNIEFMSNDKVKYDHNLYAKARSSVKQYQDNAQWYIAQHGKNAGDTEEVIPKNFKLLVLIPWDSEFVNRFNIRLEQYLYYFNNPKNIYVEIGAHILMIGCVGLVALVALLLPFVKKLQTGWEKLFSIPMEAVAGVFLACLGWSYCMFTAMSYTTVTGITREIGSVEVLGYVWNSNRLYNLALLVNLLGWMLLFFLEYLCVAHFRQFLCSPGYYFLHRILLVRFLGWLGSVIKKIYCFVWESDVRKGLHGKIIKVVVANMLIIGFCCCFGYLGIAIGVMYSVALYVIIRKRSKVIQGQYESILFATKQMADGELKIALEEDMGIFTELGEELERTKEGFVKAVEQEAKSQKMKTELISNVSHDLKTPLTAIITYVNLLKQENISSEDKKKYIQTLDMKSQRLKMLIEDLFEVSKAQSGNIVMNYMDVDVVNLMKQLRLEMEDKIADSDLAFRWNLPEEKVILRLDGQRTYRVFENLMTNVLKYAMPGSRVYVDIINSWEDVHIIFKNTSRMEMYPEAERLTDRFVRGDAARSSEGSGLGLAIVKNFVELQDGVFDIEIDGDLFKASIVWKKIRKENDVDKEVNTIV